MALAPARGEVWLASLDPARGHEQTGTRPVLVISDDLFNRGPADLVVVLPLTSRQRSILFHVSVDPPETGLERSSDILCDGVRSISKSRLVRPLGRVAEGTLKGVEERLRILLDL